MSRGKTMTTAHMLRAFELYEQGHVDREVAEELGFATQTMCDFRKKHDIPSNGKRRWTADEDETVLHAFTWLTKELKRTVGAITKRANEMAGEIEA